MNKMWVVTWTNHVVGQISSDSIKCFEEHDTALAFAKLMSGNYQYVISFLYVLFIKFFNTW